MKGVCIETGLSAILREGRTYFLRDHGKNNYYVSNFDNPKSCFGSFQKSYFKVVEDEKPEPVRLKRYVAKVARRYSWYAMGDEYIITDVDHNGYFHVYLKSGQPGPIGSYLNSFFEIIEPFEEPKKGVIVETPGRPILEPIRITGIVVSNKAEKAEGKKRERADKVKKTKQLVPDGQMDIFEFLMEG